MDTGLIFLVSLQPMKCIEFLLPKGSLLDTTILLISISFIEIGFSFQ